MPLNAPDSITVAFTISLLVSYKEEQPEKQSVPKEVTLLIVLFSGVSPSIHSSTEDVYYLSVVRLEQVLKAQYFISVHSYGIVAVCNPLQVSKTLEGILLIFPKHLISVR